MLTGMPDIKTGSVKSGSTVIITAQSWEMNEIALLVTCFIPQEEQVSKWAAWGQHLLSSFAEILFKHRDDFFLSEKIIPRC